MIELSTHRHGMAGIAIAHAISKGPTVDQLQSACQARETANEGRGGGRGRGGGGYSKKNWESVQLASQKPYSM